MAFSHSQPIEFQSITEPASMHNELTEYENYFGSESLLVPSSVEHEDVPLYVDHVAPSIDLSIKQEPNSYQSDAPEEPLHDDDDREALENKNHLIGLSSQYNSYNTERTLEYKQGLPHMVSVSNQYVGGELKRKWSLDSNADDLEYPNPSQQLNLLEADHQKGPFFCCSRQFPTRKGYRNHLRFSFKHRKLQQSSPAMQPKYELKIDKVTSGKRPYFRDKGRKKKFVCPECFTGFTQSTNLRTHRRKFHGVVFEPSQSPLFCCSKTFKTRGALMTHQRSKQHVLETTDQQEVVPKVEEPVVVPKTSESPIEEMKAAGNTSVPELKLKLFVCPDCSSGFTIKKNLEKHRKKFHSNAVINKPAENQMVCCSQVFTNSVRWYNHRRSCQRNVGASVESPEVKLDESEVPSFASPEYPEGVATKKKLVKNPVAETIKCPLCPSMSFKSVHALSMHRVWNHSRLRKPVGGSTYTCCSLTFNSSKAYMSHKETSLHKRVQKIHGKTHPNEKKPSRENELPTELTKPQSAKSKSKLPQIESQPSTTTAAEVAYACKHCDFKSLSVVGYKNHMIWKHPPTNAAAEPSSIANEPSKEKQLGKTLSRCPKCPKTFLSKKWMKNHYLRKHKRQQKVVDNTPEESSSQESFTCCSRQFATSTALQIHKSRLHKEKEEIPTEDLPQDDALQCYPCNRQFDSIVAWMKHRKEEHFLTDKNATNPAASTGQFKCDKCDRQFLSSANLGRHFKAAHLVKTTDP